MRFAENSLSVDFEDFSAEAERPGFETANSVRRLSSDILQVPCVLSDKGVSRTKSGQKRVSQAVMCVVWTV